MPDDEEPNYAADFVAHMTAATGDDWQKIWSAPEVSVEEEVIHTLHRGQVRLAQLFAAAYRDRLMFIYGIGWHYYDSTRWVADDCGMAGQAVLTMLEDGLTSDDKDLLTDIHRCETSHGMHGILTVAASMRPFAYTTKDLDADPYLLNTVGGTLDLKTFEYRDHDPADKITKVCGGSYKATSTGPMWEMFLARVLPAAEVREFLQRYVGLGLLGAVREHVLAIFTGTGANGKDTLCKAIAHALGDYATVAEPGLFMHREGGHPAGEMALRGVRWVTVSETDKGHHLAEATMKRLTGGGTITARYMRQNWVTFTPSHTAALVTNHLPKVTGDDPALWRRLRVVPFDVVIPDGEQDTRLDERLKSEVDAILTWAIVGYRSYVEGGLAEPGAVKGATGDYRKESDALARFIEDCCHLADGESATTRTLFCRWEKWCRSDGSDAGSEKAFAQDLDRRGLPAKKTKIGAVRRGIGLVPEEDDMSSNAYWNS